MENVLVAGIGGASLGTEVMKCLALAGGYRILGCDISARAFGMHDPTFADTFVVDLDSYVDDILRICREHAVRAVVPGGEGPLRSILDAAKVFAENGVLIASNTLDVVNMCLDKALLFEELERLGVPIPWTVRIGADGGSGSGGIPSYPCVIKPARDSGGSRNVFLVENPSEFAIYAPHVLKSTTSAIAQEYVGAEEGEYTIGVLTLPDAGYQDSIALKRALEAKLSVSSEGSAGVISSGYSQGLIDDFPEVRRQAERIAEVLGSRGPINVQGRVRAGVLLPFEVNPRFSASEYLRALAGFNEVDIYLKHALLDLDPASPSITPGYYLRSLTERFVPKDRVDG